MKIAVCIPIRPSLHPTLKRRCTELALILPDHNPTHEFSFFFDYRKIEPLDTDTRAWSKVARIRNAMLGSIRAEYFDFLLWIDADVTHYSPDMPTRLLGANPTGISAPLVLVEGSDTQYDWAGFILHGRSHIEPDNALEIPGRNLSGKFPYWPADAVPAEHVVPMDVVGTITLVPSSVYATGVCYEDHPSMTDHFPVCARAREMGLPVVVHRDVVAYHGYLPTYGEGWHKHKE